METAAQSMPRSRTYKNWDNGDDDDEFNFIIICCYSDNRNRCTFSFLFIDSYINQYIYGDDGVPSNIVGKLKI